MNTQTNNTNRTASSEGTQAHSDKANIALNVKYFKVVHRMTHEEAQTKVQQIIKEGGDLLSNAQCNAAIASFNKDEDRRERQAKERAEHEEKVKQAETEKAQAKKGKNEGNISSEHRETIDNLINEGNTIPQLKGYLQYKGYSAKVIKAFLATLDLKKAHTRQVGRDQAFINSFVERAMTHDEFDEFIASGSENVKRQRKFYEMLFHAFNAIHAKYNK